MDQLGEGRKGGKRCAPAFVDNLKSNKINIADSSSSHTFHGFRRLNFWVMFGLHDAVQTQRDQQRHVSKDVAIEMQLGQRQLSDVLQVTQFRRRSWRRMSEGNVKLKQFWSHCLPITRSHHYLQLSRSVR